MAGYQVQAIHDATRVLDFFSSVHRLATFQEIAAATGVAGANLTRALASLKADGYAEEPSPQRWVAGPRLAAAAAGAFGGRLARAALEIERIVHELEHAKGDRDGQTKG